MSTQYVHVDLECEQMLVKRAAGVGANSEIRKRGHEFFDREGEQKEKAIRPGTSVLRLLRGVRGGLQVAAGTHDNFGVACGIEEMVLSKSVI